MKRTCFLSLPLLLVACSQGSSSTPEQPEQKQGSPATDKRLFEFPVYPGARHFCGGSVTGGPGSGHISWETYQSSDNVQDVVEYYVGALGAENRDHSETSDTWRFPADQPTRVLSIEKPGTRDRVPWDKCKLPSGARTILSFSTMTR